ncbi:zinc metalloprotease [Arthrobacter sedimenti]|uniref:M43 family zinc metalloprotease n=1 Tax=Arthrobacter sedimenti TaxID=2694931 RepID=UPI00111DD754|nr:M43 family zinc metalloprotease [Arthrobacter sedimenti]
MTVQLAGKTVADTDAINMTAARNSITSANSYWKSASAGRLSITKVNEFRHKSAAKITDSYGTIMATVTRELGWQYRSYESLVIFVPHADLNYNGSWGILGGGFTDSSTSGRVIMPYPSALTNNVVTHEFGHVLGLHHANSLACTNGRSDVPQSGGSWTDPACWSSEYGDTSDLMGYAQVSSPAINAFLWEYGGFGRGDEVRNLGTPTSSQSLTLLPWSGTAAGRAVKFKDPVSGETYYLELRAPVGSDVATAVGGNRGVKITKQDVLGWSGNASIVLTPNSFRSGWGNTTLTWQQGQTFATHSGTRVRIDSVSNNAATVSILLNNAPALGSFDNLMSSRNENTAFLKVQGWAADPNNPSLSTEAHAYVTGPDGVRKGHIINATGSRPDVNAALALGGNHGFDGDISVTRSGSYEVCVFAIAGSGNTALGCKTVRVSNAEPPIGSFDELRVTRANDRVALTVKGWALDPSRSSISTPAHVYVTAPNGVRTGYAFTANKTRTDVNNSLAVTGQHGYDESISINAPGRYSVCSHAIGQYFNTALGCKTVEVSAAPPIGSLDEVKVEKTSTSALLRIRGWTMERENALASIPVHIYVTDPSGRRTGTAFSANKTRSDVNTAFSVAGNHGYEETVQAPIAGLYEVCAYGIAVSPSSTENTRLGCISVNTGFAEAPKGYLDSARIDATADGIFLEARGWTVDRDMAPASTTVHTYITYPDGSRRGFAYPTGQLRTDANRALGIGGQHGYTTRTPITQRGTYQVCTYGIGISPYSPGNSPLGCASVRY